MWPIVAQTQPVRNFEALLPGFSWRWRGTSDRPAYAHSPACRTLAPATDWGQGTCVDARARKKLHARASWGCLRVKSNKCPPERGPEPWARATSSRQLRGLPDSLRPFLDLLGARPGRVDQELSAGPEHRHLGHVQARAS